MKVISNKKQISYVIAHIKYKVALKYKM